MRCRSRRCSFSVTMSGTFGAWDTGGGEVTRRDEGVLYDKIYCIAFALHHNEDLLSTCVFVYSSIVAILSYGRCADDTRSCKPFPGAWFRNVASGNDGIPFFVRGNFTSSD